MAHASVFLQYSTWACIHTVPEYATGKRSVPNIPLGGGEGFLSADARDKWRAFCLARGIPEETARQDGGMMQVQDGAQQHLDPRGYTARTNAAMAAYFEAREREHVAMLIKLAPQAEPEPESEQVQDLDLWSILLKDDIEDITRIEDLIASPSTPPAPATDASLLELEGIPMDIDAFQFDFSEFIDL